MSACVCGVRALRWLKSPACQESGATVAKVHLMWMPCVCVCVCVCVSVCVYVCVCVVCVRVSHHGSRPVELCDTEMLVQAALELCDLDPRVLTLGEEPSRIKMEASTSRTTNLLVCHKLHS